MRKNERSRNVKADKIIKNAKIYTAAMVTPYADTGTCGSNTA